MASAAGLPERLVLEALEPVRVRVFLPPLYPGHSGRRGGLSSGT
ncbi:hypothetical protein QS306_15445 [Paraburkholderia bonniea]|nr:hypothetical protein [Paraburkholderia bonniea]WJF92149.1 hypothetical protein QS306_15445 [Paraburkholderia bonniea]WJF95469.1 hypothetical protein QS308_15450 [Paraburkholderia bonniea]